MKLLINFYVALYKLYAYYYNSKVIVVFYFKNCLICTVNLFLRTKTQVLLLILQTVLSNNFN